jgi:uncharacterized protein YoxC
MKPIELVLIIVILLAALYIVAGTIYFIITLIQIKKTAKELENVMQGISAELDIPAKISSKGALIIEKLSSPIISIVSVLFYVLSCINKRKNIRKFSEEVADTISDLSNDFKETGRKFYEKGREKVLSDKDKISKAFEVGKKALEEFNKED